MLVPKLTARPKELDLHICSRRSHASRLDAATTPCVHVHLIVTIARLPLSVSTIMYTAAVGAGLDAVAACVHVRLVATTVCIRHAHGPGRDRLNFVPP